ncbi:MAG: hypothetical protein R2940_00870 [Syntrophotaleaceae bacterium]
MWKRQSDGAKIFGHGQESFELAAEAAGRCNGFQADVEEEWVADEERSCYNCRLRRWTSSSFVCLFAG